MFKFCAGILFGLFAAEDVTDVSTISLVEFSAETFFELCSTDDDVLVELSEENLTEFST
jgi:hypothetical protein